ncbi:MAG TPA: hypothetical protein VE130_12660 [Nitrososphaeraceae archaeon]|jgi:hypothetical protein|nr:hypothetical protein [Nitrososphaeraceae archaeon]
MLTYRVWVFRPDMSINMVIVDPGTGQALSNRQVQHPMMAGMMGMGPGIMGMGHGTQWQIITVADKH